MSSLETTVSIHSELVAEICLLTFHHLSSAEPIPTLTSPKKWRGVPFPGTPLFAIAVL
jgi:hypothetical protein